MPVISTLGAASSRGFGEFLQTASAPKYIEQYFSTSVYTGYQEQTVINSGVPLATTTEWSTYSLSFSQNGFTDARTKCAVDSSGNSYIFATNQVSPEYGFIAKFNPTGVLQWQRKLTFGTSGCVVSGGGVDSSGNVYVTGYFVQSASQIMFIAKYNSSGVLQWQNKSGLTSTYGSSIHVDSSDNVYVTGQSTGSSLQYCLVLKIDGSGNILLQRRLYESQSWGTDITTDSSGNIIVCGTAYDLASSYRYGLLAKYTSTGTLSWQRKINFSSTDYNTTEISAVTTDSSGNVYAVGNVLSAPVALAILKYNSSGTIQWRKALAAPGSSPSMSAKGICVDSSGNVYVSARYGTQESIFAKYDSAGNLQWVNQGFRPSGNNLMFGDINIDSSNNIYIGIANGKLRLTKLKAGNAVSGFAAYGFAASLAQNFAITISSNTGTATSANSSETFSAASLTDAADTAASTIDTQVAIESTAGLAWIKQRSENAKHYLFDTARGSNLYLSSNSSNGNTSASDLIAFNAAGISIGTSTEVNKTPEPFVNWNFRKAPKFFDIVPFTYGSVNDQQIPHSLGVVPGMIIIKRTSSNGDWYVRHRGLSGGIDSGYIIMQSTGAQLTFGSGSPNSATTFNASAFVGGIGSTYVAYLFAHDAGGFGLSGTDSVISCGSYTGNGSATGPTVSLGWEPQFILIKNASGTGNWQIFDNLRGIPNGAADSYLNANLSGAESTANGDLLDLTATGFNIKSTNSNVNTNGSTYIYMAIRRGPMAVPTSGTSIFMPTVYTGNNTDNRLIETTIQPDMLWVRQRNNTVLSGMVLADRLRGNEYLLTGSLSGQTSAADAFDAQYSSATALEFGNAFTSNIGFWCGNNATAKLNVDTTSNNHIVEAFKRAPKVFDATFFTGTGSNQTVNHNLGVTPELIILRNVGTIDNFTVGCLFNAQFVNYYTAIYLNSFTAGSLATNGSGYGLTGAVSSSTFGVEARTAGTSNIAYLFATCPGVSKVGTFIGNNSTQTINCGFTTGARFVLIKAISTTSNWMLWDSARGITTTNDPLLLVNSTSAETSGADAIQPNNTGFIVQYAGPDTDSAPNRLNVSYLYLAIA